MEKFFHYAEKYGVAAVAMFFILWANYKGVWCWSKAADKALEEERQRHAETKVERDMWRASFFHAMGLATSTANVLERSAPK